MKKKHFIDSHKTVTSLFILALMAYYNAWENLTAWVYLALHGTYTLLWVIKSNVFPDQTWEQKIGIGYGLFMWGGLCLYWIAPYIIVSRQVHVPLWYICLCISVWGFGLFFHFVSDMQKHLWLSLRPGTLMTGGLWARCRNPNYFGELLIYVGFIALAMHWLPAAALLFMVLGVFVPNMIKKDRSLSRYPDFATYRQSSKMFIPYLI